MALHEFLYMASCCPYIRCMFPLLDVIRRHSMNSNILFHLTVADVVAELQDVALQLVL